MSTKGDLMKAQPLSDVAATVARGFVLTVSAAGYVLPAVLLVVALV